MKEDKDIEKFIRENIRYDKAPEGFSDRIIDRINTSEAKEDIALTSLVGKFAIESPSPDFTSKVMSQLQESPSIVTNPVIIGKKAWILIAALMAAFVYYVLVSFGESGSEPAAYTQFMESLGERFNQAGGSLNSQIPEILTNPVFALSMFALSSMLLLDYVMRKRKLSVI